MGARRPKSVVTKRSFDGRGIELIENSQRQQDCHKALQDFVFYQAAAVEGPAFCRRFRSCAKDISFSLLKEEQVENFRQQKFRPISDTELATAWSDPHWISKFPPIMTVSQAAALLQISKATLYDWSSRKLLADCSRRCGKHLRFLRDRLVRFYFERGIQPK